MHRSYTICGRSLEVFLGDITDLPVDAIVSSENSDLWMDDPSGPSVSAAIRRIEGEDFARETARLGPLPLGHAVPLAARRLRARWVIHAASVEKKGETHETTPAAIARAVRTALSVAAGLGLRSVAMPAFGVRAARVPREVASEVMVEAVAEHLSGPTSLERVVLALLEPESFLLFFERAILRARAADTALVLHLERRGDDVLARFEETGALATVSRAQATGRDLDLAREKLDRLARARERLGSDRARELRATGGFVWSFLLPDAARERLRAASARTLVLRTDDALSLVPWELAWDGEAFLAQRFSVSRGLVSEGAPRAPRGTVRRAIASLLLVAAPTGDLPAANREAESLLDVFFQSGRVRAELLGGERASRERVLARLSHVRALHFAGHALRTETGEPRWPLGNGTWLEPSDLGRSDAGHLALVFANACAPLGPSSQTASERLAWGRAFLHAGVEGFVGTLWEVEDEPAARFAAVFWTEVLEGKTIGDALRHARAALRTLGASDWAAYVHFGDPNARVFDP